MLIPAQPPPIQTPILHDDCQPDLIIEINLKNITNQHIPDHFKDGLSNVLAGFVLCSYLAATVWQIRFFNGRGTIVSYTRLLFQYFWEIIV